MNAHSKILIIIYNTVVIYKFVSIKFHCFMTSIWIDSSHVRIVLELTTLVQCILHQRTLLKILLNLQYHIKKCWIIEKLTQFDIFPSIWKEVTFKPLIKYKTPIKLLDLNNIVAKISWFCTPLWVNHAYFLLIENRFLCSCNE